MTPLMSYLAGFGLASGVGAKAFIPVLLLGVLHHTQYFELSERFRWIADPAVLIVLAVLVVVELAVDAHPELGRWADSAAYLPKWIAGFIGFAAVVGTVDDSLRALAASGLLGGGTAAGVHWLRNRLRRPLRDGIEDLHEGIGRTASLAEGGASLTMAGSAFVFPPLSLLLVGAATAFALAAGRLVDRRRIACVHCGGPIRPGAVVCIHCGGEQGAARRG